jgi:hypothetical protein
MRRLSNFLQPNGDDSIGLPRGGYGPTVVRVLQKQQLRGARDQDLLLGELQLRLDSIRRPSKRHCCLQRVLQPGIGRVVSTAYECGNPVCDGPRRVRRPCALRPQRAVV